MSENYKTIPELARYIDRIGAEQLNFRRFMVKQYKENYYTEKALITIDDKGEIACSRKEYEPTDEERAGIKHAFIGVDFPKHVEAQNTLDLRAMLKTSSANSLFEFVSRRTGGVIMVQQRVQDDDGSKKYLPWTFWSDGKWRCMEPAGSLPFWKPRAAISPRIMVHEGAKSASHVEWMLRADDPKARALRARHPWAEELAEYEHWGMIGGALAPHRADYAEIHAVKPIEMVYVCDNDFPGEAALQEVSRCYGGAMKGIMFGKSFPPSWDMGDDMPAALFSASGRWTGPPLAELLEPATRATEQVFVEHSKKPVTVVTRAFREEWAHCIRPEVYVHNDWPNRLLSPSEFSSKVRPFSNVDDTARILKQDAARKSAVLSYDPSRPPGIFSSERGRFINTHVPSRIRAEPGDATPFLDYMEHLIPDPSDRHETLRWVASLIARPDIKILYGLLLISETQGVGKTTLGEKILAPILGRENVSQPSESAITDSVFNDWVAHKRLAIVNEIYAGQSAKAYNKLKETITERVLTINQKYQTPYSIDSWVHILACSNSLRALKFDDSDRRWLVPMVTEETKPVAWWRSLNDWIVYDGGLGIIAHWAIGYAEAHPILHGAPAPQTSRKREIIESSMSEGMYLVQQTLREIMEEGPEDAIVLDVDLVRLIQDKLYQGRNHDRLEKPATVRRVAKNLGWHIGEKQIKLREWGHPLRIPRIISRKAEDTTKTAAEIAAEGRRPVDLERWSTV